MNNKIPTLYSNYQECMLDLDIYGKIVSAPHQSIQELTDTLFEEFKHRKPFPTLEYKRYELSKLVSPEYRIVYNRELELQDNESIIDLRRGSPTVKVTFEDLTPLINEVQEVFSYQNAIHDDLRQQIVETYDLSTGEEFEQDIEKTEEIVGSIEMDDTSYTDEDIENFGHNTSDADSDEVDFYSAYGSEEESESDDYSVYESDDGVSVECESIEDTPVDEPSEEDEGDDYSVYESDGEDEGDDYSVYESDEDNSLRDSDDFDDYSAYENDEDSSDSVDTEVSEEGQGSKDETVDIEDDPIDISPHNVIDNDLVDDIEFVSEKVIVTPPTPAQIPTPRKEEPVDRSSEPTDIRQFLRKHPHCDYSFVLKYFTKKQIEDAIRVGKIVKKGNTLKI